jgi:hypothetical protein
MTKDDQKLVKSPQFKQWQQLGLVEIIVDLGEALWRWTDKGNKHAKYSTRSTVTNFVKGLPLYPVEEDRARIEPLIRKDWLKDGFTEDGYVLVDA